MYKIKIFLYTFFCLFLLFGNVSQAAFKLTVHRIGAGSCAVLEDRQASGQKEYMLIDCGSRGYGSANEYSPSVTNSPSPLPDISSQPMDNTMDTEELLGDDYGAEETITKPKTEVVKDIRRSLGSTDCTDPTLKASETCPLRIKSIFLSHPDKDHYNFIRDLIKPEDTIDYIVVGGDLDSYTVKQNGRTFSDWIENQGATAILTQDTTSIERGGGIFLHPQLPDFTTHTSYYLAVANTPYLKFSDESTTEVILMGVNATSLGNNNPYKLVNMSIDMSDDNHDSLIVKVRNKETGESVIISGDATGITTSPLVAEVNYFNTQFERWKTKNPTREVTEFPNYTHLGVLYGLFDKVTTSRGVTVFVSDHHGAARNGSNHPDWIRLLSMQYVFVSSGTLDGHPWYTAYENFQVSPYIAGTEPNSTINPHKMVTGVINSENSWNPKKWRVSTTNRPVLTTFSNGTLVANFPDDSTATITSMVYEEGGPVPIQHSVDVAAEGDIVEGLPGQVPDTIPHVVDISAMKVETPPEVVNPNPDSIASRLKNRRRKKERIYKPKEVKTPKEKSREFATKRSKEKREKDIISRRKKN